MVTVWQTKNLTKYNSSPRSSCYDFDKVMSAKRDELRQMLQGKDVVYIYQKQIDERGESSSAENEVHLIYCDDMKFEKILERYDTFQEKWEEKN